MRKLKVLCVLPVLLLQGCFFFYVPGSFIDAAADGINGVSGQHCVASTAREGDYIRMADGSSWKVKKLEGTSYRCRVPQHPIRAQLEPS